MKRARWACGVLALTVLAACGSDGKSVVPKPLVKPTTTTQRQLTPAERVIAGAKAMDTLASVRVQVKQEQRAARTGDPLHDSVAELLDSKFDMQGRADLKTLRAEYEIDYASVAAVFKSLKEAKGRMRLVGSSGYLEVGPFRQFIAGLGGKAIPEELKNVQWVGLPNGSGAKADLMNTFFGYAGLVLTASPASTLTIGSETIADVTTTHFKVQVDVDQAQATLKANGATIKNDVVKLLEAQTKPMISVEVWLDTQNRIRRFTFDDLLSPSDDEGATVNFLMEFSDFGVDVSDIVAPPASDVAPASALDSLFG